MENTLIIFLSGLAGLAVGIIIMMIVSRAGLNRNQQKAALLLKEAESKADSVVKQAVLDGRTQAHELKIVAEKEIKERRQEITDMENKLLRREDNLNSVSYTHLDVYKRQMLESIKKPETPTSRVPVIKTINIF